MRSFSVMNKTRQARQLWNAYQIDSTPMIGVGGIYATGPHLVGTREGTPACIDYLIEQDSRSAQVNRDLLCLRRPQAYAWGAFAYLHYPLGDFLCSMSSLPAHLQASVPLWLASTHPVAPSSGLVARNRDKLEALADALPGGRDRNIVLPCDVTVREEVFAAAEEL